MSAHWMSAPWNRLGDSRLSESRLSGMTPSQDGGRRLPSAADKQAGRKEDSNAIRPETKHRSSATNDTVTAQQEINKIQEKN